MQLIIDSTVYSEPEWDLIEDAFEKLLANKANEIILGNPPGTAGLIASGENDSVTVFYADPDNRIEAELRNPNPQGTTKDLIIGGIRTEVKDTVIVSKTMALKVFKLFYEGQDILKANDLKWS